ncbi:MAG: hypothetical protein ACE5K2_06935, partial [Candidatus Zixiibacteriota bacterium]
ANILNFNGLLKACVAASQANSGGIGHGCPGGDRTPVSDKEEAECTKKKQTDSAPSKAGAVLQEPPQDKDCLSAPCDSLKEKAHDFGYRNIDAEIQRYGEDYVSEKIQFVGNLMAEGKVHNPAAFLNSALHHNYRTDEKADLREAEPQPEERADTPLKKLWYSLSEEQKAEIEAEAEMRLSDRERDELYKGFRLTTPFERVKIRQKFVLSNFVAIMKSETYGETLLLCR